jgi:hypothetical protein
MNKNELLEAHLVTVSAWEQLVVMLWNVQQFDSNGNYLPVSYILHEVFNFSYR